MEDNNKPQSTALSEQAAATTPPPPPPVIQEQAEATAPSEAESLAALLGSNPVLAAFVREVAEGANPEETAARHFGQAKPAGEEEVPSVADEPAMYRSSLEPPGAPRPFPTFLSNISRSFWEM